MSTRRNNNGGNQQVVYAKKKRSVDKQIINVTNNFSNSQGQTILYTATFPCTVMGIRVQGTVQSAPDTSASPDAVAVALIVLRQGFTTPNGLSLSNTGTLYQPEADVIWYRAGISDTFVNTGDGAFIASMELTGAPKTMRKLEAGDRLLMIYNGSTADVKNIFASVQFFLKV